MANGRRWEQRATYKDEERDTQSSGYHRNIELLLHHANVHAEDGACERDGKHEKAHRYGYNPSLLLRPVLWIARVVGTVELYEITLSR